MSHGKENKSCKEIAKEIRDTFKQLKNVKLSVTSDCNHIQVDLMKADFNIFIEEKENSTYYTGYPINHFWYKDNENLTTEVKTLFQLVDEIINKYHWDESDAMTDYFNCAFYYSYGIGKWNKEFIKL